MSSNECEVCHNLSDDASCCSKCQVILCPKCKENHKCLNSRPPCPDCGAEDPTSKGYRWRCKKCGREYLKEYRGPYKKRNIRTQDLYTEEHINVDRVVDV